MLFLERKDAAFLLKRFFFSFYITLGKSIGVSEVLKGGLFKSYLEIACEVLRKLHPFLEVTLPEIAALVAYCVLLLISSHFALGLLLSKGNLEE